VSFGHHALDNRNILCGGINCTLSEVVSSDHKGSFSTVSCKFVEKVISVKIRSVIESESNVYRSRYVSVSLQLQKERRKANLRRLHNRKYQLLHMERYQYVVEQYLLSNHQLELGVYHRVVRIGIGNLELRNTLLWYRSI
jgi:hypothetical protein